MANRADRLVAQATGDKQDRSLACAGFALHFVACAQTLNHMPGCEKMYVKVCTSAVDHSLLTQLLAQLDHHITANGQTLAGSLRCELPRPRCMLPVSLSRLCACICAQDACVYQMVPVDR